jgi:phosphoheptose isomerase
METLIHNELDLLFAHYPVLKDCGEQIRDAFRMLSDCYHSKGLIMVCGNGGSAADAEHMVGELMKGFKLKRRISREQQLLLHAAFPAEAAYLSENLQQAIPAISLVSQTSVSTAFINDVAADMVFAQLVLGYGKAGDVLIGLSTTGNSRNVVNACKVAKALGIRTIGFTGANESRLSEICDIAIRVPAQEVYRVQELHQPVYHTLCAMLESEAFGCFK